MDNKTTYTTKSDYVFSILKKRIIDHTYKPGDELVISKIAKELNVSIIPVREALRTLESVGMILIEPHKVAQVASFDLNELQEIILVRAGLEGYAARISAEKITKDEICKLEEYIAESIEAVSNNDIEKFNESNLEFHKYLYKIASLPMLYNMIINVWESYKWTGSIFAVSSKRFKESIDEHKDILAAIKEKNIEKVEKLVRKHRMNAGKELERTIINSKGKKTENKGV